MLCETPQENCYFGRCERCPNKVKFEEILEKLFEESNVLSITYKQWISNPKTTLETMVKSTEEFIPYLCEELCKLMPHAFIATQQSAFSRATKENLGEGEVQVIVDFAENYAFTVQDAIPGFHWNNDRATVYNIVIYYKENTDVKHRSLVIISDCLTHDSIAVYTFHKILIEYLKSEFSSVKKVLYFSDGAPQQYKNYKNVINLAFHQNDFDIPAEWNFYATAHGKGPCDGLGAVVKRAALRASLQSTDKHHILTPKDLFDWLSTTGRLPNVDFRFSLQADYNYNKRFLAKRFKISTRIDHLQEKHCLVCIENGVVRAKSYSTSEIYQDFKIF